MGGHIVWGGQRLPQWLVDIFVECCGSMCVCVCFSVSVNAICASCARYRTVSLGHDIVKWTHSRSISQYHLIDMNTNNTFIFDYTFHDFMQFAKHIAVIDVVV